MVYIVSSVVDQWSVHVMVRWSVCVVVRWSVCVVIDVCLYDGFPGVMEMVTFVSVEVVEVFLDFDGFTDFAAIVMGIFG